MEDKAKVFFEALAQLLTDHHVILNSGDVRFAVNNNNYTIKCDAHRGQMRIRPQQTSSSGYYLETHQYLVPNVTTTTTKNKKGQYGR